ncbi:MAG: phosphohydrolase, partial [Desulfobacterales bacterium S3730MH5]
MKESSKKEDRPLYSSRIIDTYIRLVRRKYSYVNIRELLDSAKMEPYEVADQGHWFTQEQINLFYEKLLEVTDNEQIAREAGRYAASAEAIGVMRQYLLGMVGPAKIYEMIGKASANFTKSSLFESKKIASHKVEICVKPREGVSEKPFQCENRIGFFEAASMIFDTKLPRIEHPECLFKGGNLCRYIISWEETYSSLWKRIRNHAALFLFLTCLVVVFVDPSITLKVVLPVSAVVVLVLTLIGEYIGKEELKASLYNLSDSSDKLLEQIEINYNNAVMTNEIGQAISKHTTMEDVLAKVVQVSEKRLNYDRGLILLVNPEKTRLLFRAGFGYSEDRFGLLKRTAFHLDRPESRGVFIVSFKEQKPFLINDIREIEHYFSQRSLEFAKKMGTQSFICCPIICDGESIGVFAVDCVKSKRPLVASDLSLLLGIASVIGINIRNADLLEAKAKQFRSMIQVLAASIDARDPMTAGHSEKVTEYA